MQHVSCAACACTEISRAGRVIRRLRGGHIKLILRFGCRCGKRAGVPGHAPAGMLARWHQDIRSACCPSPSLLIWMSACPVSVLGGPVSMYCVNACCTCLLRRIAACDRRPCRSCARAMVLLRGALPGHRAGRSIVGQPLHPAAGGRSVSVQGVTRAQASARRLAGQRRTCEGAAISLNSAL